MVLTNSTPNTIKLNNTTSSIMQEADNESGFPLNLLFPKYPLLEQFTESVVEYTSRYNIIDSISYAPINVCGGCGRYPQYGDFPDTYMLRSYGKWWRESEGAQKSYRPHDEEDIVSEDYIVLGFETPVVPIQIIIYETYNPGAVVRIFGKLIGGNWHLLYEAPPEKCEKTSRKFMPELRKINDVVNLIRIEFNQSLLDYHTSLDAVLLAGYEVKSDLQRYMLKKGLGLFKPVVKPKAIAYSNEEYEGDNYFDTLPYEVIVHIFQYLDLKSLSRCATVCKRWHEATLDSAIYQNISLKKYWVKVDNGTLRYLKMRCKQLKKLDLSWCGNNFSITEDVFQDFMKKCGKQLTHLSVCNCDFVKNVTIGEISNCFDLVDLRLRNCFPSPWTFSFLSKLTKLVALDLYSTAINDEMLVRILTSNRLLKHLNIDFCENLNRMDQVTEAISIYNSRIITFSCWKTRSLSANGVKYLARCAQLRELDMGWCLLTTEPEDCLEKIAQGCTDLRRLILSNWRGLNDHHLLPIIRSCKQLTQLDLLGIKKISSDICECAFASLPKLRLVDISFCEEIQREQVEMLRRMYPNITIQRSCEWDTSGYYS